MQAEQMIVEAVRSGYFQARFDHKNNTVHFGGQEVESDRIRGHIAAMAKRLTRALAVINPAPAGGWHVGGGCMWALQKFDEPDVSDGLHSREFTSTVRAPLPLPQSTRRRAAPSSWRWPWPLRARRTSAC